MSGAHDRIDASVRGRSIAPLVLAALAVLVLAGACAPRALPIAAGDATSTVDRSIGCDVPVPLAAPDRLPVAGAERGFLARVPAGPSRVPRDLVLAFHGRTNDAAQARRYFGLDIALPEAIVVYPRALPAAPGTFAWGDPGDAPERLRDFALVHALIDAFGAAHCVDLDRVFVVGHSLGAYFANDVACRLGDRVRAVASVAGGLQGGACRAGTAALLVHHPDDPLVPFAAGVRAREAFRSANGASRVAPAPATHAALVDLGCVRYGSAEARDPVLWCAHDDATSAGGRYDPHTWPDAAPAAIAAFFAGLP